MQRFKMLAVAAAFGLFGCVLLAQEGSPTAVVAAQTKEGRPTTPKSVPATPIRDVSGNENGWTAVVIRGTHVKITLPSNITTGYAWYVDSLQNDPEGTVILQQIGEVEYGEAGPAKVGAPSTSIFTFKTLSVGKGTVNLSYRRPEEQTARKTFRATIDVLEPGGEDSFRAAFIRARGILHNEVFARGAETTGCEVKTADGTVYQLHFPAADRDKLIGLATELDEKKVEVTGDFSYKKRVEEPSKPPRRIIIVRTLKAEK